MVDIYKQKSSKDCIKCGEKIEVTLQQCCDNETIFCVCGSEINLIASQEEINKVKEFDKKIKELEKTLKNFGKRR